MRSCGFIRLVAVRCGIALLSGAILAAAEQLTPAGLPRNQALYVPMRDGVKIAVDVWLPVDLAAGARVPAIIKMTPNWRAVGLVKQTGAMRLLSMTGAIPTEDFNTEEATIIGKAGYAIVYVDTRGTGASFGVKTSPFSFDEIADYGEVVDWITKQPWSNGTLAALGVQYDGTAAELILAACRPAIKAVVPLFSDFDPWGDNIAPGGVVNDWFLKFWQRGSRMLDTNDLVEVAKYRHRDYDLLKRVIYGVKRVDTDSDGVMLASAIKLRAANVDLYKAGHQVEYRDTPFGATGKTFDAVSPIGLKDAIEASKVPMFVWTSWLDAGSARGALARFVEFTNPQIVVIGPWSHESKFDVNPFGPPDAAAKPSKEERYAQYLAFLDDCLKGNATPAREVRYFTMGENAWKTTAVWPPKDVSMQRWYFEADSALSTTAPTAADGADVYSITFDATTGASNRWHTQADGDDVIYPDRATEDKKLLTYTSGPLDRAVEITGHPVVTLFAASTATDGAFYVYLEMIAPDGRVIYVTEGMLRAVHRKVSADAPPHAVFGPNHTFKHADAQPLEPGQVAEIGFDLLPTSVRILQGYRLRVSVAGHDASGFTRYPVEGDPVISLARNTQHASCIDLPIIAR
jgi:hypothetical protein